MTSLIGKRTHIDRSSKMECVSQAQQVASLTGLLLEGLCLFQAAGRAQSGCQLFGQIKTGIGLQALQYFMKFK